MKFSKTNTILKIQGELQGRSEEASMMKMHCTCEIFQNLQENIKQNKMNSPQNLPLGGIVEIYLKGKHRFCLCIF